MKDALRALKASLKTKNLNEPKDLDAVRQQIKDYDAACINAEKFIKNLNIQYVESKNKSWPEIYTHLRGWMETVRDYQDLLLDLIEKKPALATEFKELEQRPQKEKEQSKAGRQEHLAKLKEEMQEEADWEAKRGDEEQKHGRAPSR